MGFMGVTHRSRALAPRKSAWPPGQRERVQIKGAVCHRLSSHPDRFRPTSGDNSGQ